MKVSPHFDLRELVSREIIENRAIGNRAIDFLNVNAVNTLEFLRDKFGAITVNNWHIGGAYNESGLRPPRTSTGASLSAHKFGTGFDLKFNDTNAEKVYFYILNNQHDFKFISRMENAERTISWLHIEICTNKRAGDIVVFNP